MPERTHSEFRSEARHDLVKRLVAVTISVGFASALIKMSWLSDGTLPNVVELEWLARLSTALFVILLGWEWHHKDLFRHSETGVLRFLVDVAVVITGLIFLISSTHASAWLLCLVAIFAFYVVWDIVTFAPFVDRLSRQRRPFSWKLKAFFAKLYRDPGPGTNVLWLIYFGGIFLLYQCMFPTINLVPTFKHTLLLCFFIIVGALFLTFQGNRPHAWTWNSRLLVIYYLFVFFVFSFVRLIDQHLLPSELHVDQAKVQDGQMVISRRVGRPDARISAGIFSTATSAPDGNFRIETRNIPPTCHVQIRYGTSSSNVTLAHCEPSE